ncbi:MAG: nitroreductase family protein [Chloroflexota bacterium]
MVPHATQSSTSGDLARVIYGRRSIRGFRADPVPADLVRELVEASAWAPSPHNVQPWRFLVMTEPDDKESLARAMAEQLAVDLRADGMDDAAVSRQTGRSQDRISNAPVVILCSLARDGLAAFPDARRNSLEWQMAVQSVGAVLQTLFLLAHDSGLGTCWMAAPMYCPDVVRDTLGLSAALEPQALVLMGWPAVPGKLRERRPVDEVVTFK